MMDYDDYLKAVAEHVVAHGQHQLADLARLRDFSIQAEVETRLLTGSNEWDHFLSRLTAAQAQVLVEKTAATEKLSAHTTVEEALIRGLKAKLAWLEGMNWALEQVMELPKSILENGEKARAIELPSVAP